MATPNPMVNRPMKIRIPCAGFDPGATVVVKVLELQNLGSDPIETLQATVDPEGASATVTWTYDHSQHRDRVSRALFVFLVEGGGRTAVSRPIEFMDRFEATVADANGNVAANRDVVLHASRGQNLRASTDSQGKVSVNVPPGQYHVELLGSAAADTVTSRDLGVAQAADARVAVAGAPAHAGAGSTTTPASGGATSPVATLVVPGSIASGAESAAIQYEVVDPSATIATAVLELLGGDGAVLSSRELTADERANGSHTLPWKGEVFGASPPELPGGFLTLDHSPYNVRITATSAGGATSSRQAPVEVKCVGLTLELGPKSLLADARDQALWDTLGQLPAAGSVKKVVLVSDIFRSDSAEVHSDASYTQYRDDKTQGWSDGPRIPIVAKVLFQTSTGTSVLAPKAWGEHQVLWDWSGVAEDTTQLPPVVKTYIDGARTYLLDPRGNLCHVDLGGKRSSTGEPPVFVQAGTTPHQAGNPRLGAALTGLAVGGDLDGLTGVLFQPARIAGDQWKVSAYFGAATDLDVPGALPVPIQQSTGAFEIWRQVHIARYVKKTAAVGNIDPAPVRAHFAKAYLDVVFPASSLMSDVAGFDYDATVATEFADTFKDNATSFQPAINDPGLWVDSRVSHLATGTAAVHFRKYDAFKSAAVAKRQAELVASGSSQETAATQARSDVDAALDAMRQAVAADADPKVAPQIDAVEAYGRLCQTMGSQVSSMIGFAVAAGVGITLVHFEGAGDVGHSVEGGNTPFLALDDSRHRVVVLDFLWRGVGRDNMSVMPGDRETTAAHEIGHALFLPHALDGADQDPTAHDQTDMDGCLMSYRKQEHFCGVCNLRLRGWNFTQLPGRGKASGS